CADSSRAAARSRAPEPRPLPTPSPAPTPTRSAPPHLSLDDTDPSSLELDPDAISDATTGALFDCVTRRSIGQRASLDHELGHRLGQDGLEVLLIPPPRPRAKAAVPRGYRTAPSSCSRRRWRSQRCKRQPRSPRTGEP